MVQAWEKKQPINWSQQSMGLLSVRALANVLF